MYAQGLFVCGNCFEDPGLVEFIRSNASATECSCCPTKDDRPIAASIDDVSAHFIECLFREYDLAVSALGPVPSTAPTCLEQISHGTW